MIDIVMDDFKLWLEFENWMSESTDDLCDDFFNMIISFPDGRKYALNVWTFKFLERARNIQELEAPELIGKYLVAPDIFVEELDRHLIESVVKDLIRTEQLQKEWLVTEYDLVDE